MPSGRPRNDAKHLHAAVNGLVSAVESLVAAMERQPQRAVQLAVAPRKRGKLASAVKSSWANYTPAQRAARIAAMKAGHAKRKRALAQKGVAKVAGKVATKAPSQRASAARHAPAARKPSTGLTPKMAAAPKPASRKNAWASMSPEQRAERIARMRAGRSAKPAQAMEATAV